MSELVQWRNDWRSDQTRWTMEAQFIDESYNKRQVNKGLIMRKLLQASLR